MAVLAFRSVSHWAPALALALVLASFGAARADTCANQCVEQLTANNSSINAQCLSDCAQCLNSTAGPQCYHYFAPVFSDGPYWDASSYQHMYAFPMCFQVCSIPWWGWLLMSFMIVFVLAGCCFCCHRCIQRRKRNRSAALEAAAAYQATIAAAKNAPNPYPAHASSV